MAIRYGLRRPAEESYWGTKIHYDRCDEFLAHFVETARTIDNGLSREDRLAIVTGFCSHVGLDLSMHPLVNYIARRDQQEQGGAESHHHRLAEKYHAMFYHLDSRGHDLIGSADMLEKTRVTKRTSLVRAAAEPAVVEFATSTFQSMWGDAPTAQEWSGWVRSFAHFGFLVSGRMAQQNSLRLRTPENREHYFHCPEFNFYDFWETGRKRGLAVANRAFDYFESNDFSARARARFLLDVAFDGTLADPLGLWGPSLPKLDREGVQKESVAA